jgi:hypothetical protein
MAPRYGTSRPYDGRTNAPRSNACPWEAQRGKRREATNGATFTTRPAQALAAGAHPLGLKELTYLPALSPPEIAPLTEGSG